MPGLVQLERVSMAYGRGAAAVRAIDEVTLSIAAGEFVAVVGPSGCGKSSLMRLISGLHPPLGGSLTVEGMPVRGPLKSVGLAFQHSNLLPWRTALDNVLLPLEVVEPHRRRMRAERAAYRAKAEQLLESVGLGGFAQKFPWQLSGGMQQRTSICRALIHEPDILLLDEPFGGLDAFTREELWCALRDLQAERRVTVLLVTHDLREAVFLADTVYVMSSRPGRIVRRCKVGIPRALPYFFGSLKVAITLAFVGAVVSETVGSNKGIGKLMLDAQAAFQVPIVFAGLLMLAVLGIVLYAATAAIESRFTGWAFRGQANP